MCRSLPVASTPPLIVHDCAALPMLYASCSGARDGLPPCLRVARWFRWLNTSNIVFMAPEGPESGCTLCTYGGTVTLRPFDNSSVLPSVVDPATGQVRGWRRRWAQAWVWAPSTSARGMSLFEMCLCRDTLWLHCYCRCW